MLALATFGLRAPSETFIQDHIANIFPGATVVVCEDGRSGERFGCPILSNIRSRRPPETFAARVIDATQFRWHRYVDAALIGADSRRVQTFLEEHRVSVMLAEYGPMGCLVSRACERAGIPLFVHFHGYDASRLLRDPLWVRHYRKLFAGVAGVITPSQFLADKLVAAGCPPQKLHINPIGIDVSRFGITAALYNRVIAVGRLTAKKAPHLTIEAFSLVLRDHPDARLDMVGDGPLASQCRALVSARGLQDRVILHGALPTKRIAELLREASLFVQHSVTAEDGDTESFGISLVEAMACCVPVVTTRHNSFPETVEDGVTGVLVDEHDVSGMAAAMSALLGDCSRAASMGRAGRERVLARFTLQKSCGQLRAILGLDDGVRSAASDLTTAFHST